MDQLEDMIGSVLNNPDQMQKIMDIAGSIMGSNPNSNDKSFQAQDNPQETPASPANLNLPDMSGIQDLIGNSSVSLGNISKALSLVQSPRDREKTALLESMLPWLSEKRRGKLKTAMKLAKVMRAAGIMFLKDGGRK